MPNHISKKPKAGPLKDIRILDLSRLLPAPMATMFLADLGAEVIKIENPNSPDNIRYYPPFIGGESAYYYALNRSKKSLRLDLRSEKGRQIFLELAKTADIIIESFRPNVVQKIGIDYETIKQINEKIIYISVTGYGQKGTYSHQAGHDINYIGYTGIQGLTGDENGRLTMIGTQVADIAGGAYMTLNACTTALFHRERSGEGDHIDVAMVDACLPFMSMSMADYWATGNVPKAGEALLIGGLANYNLYKCKDNKYITLAALEPKFWIGFCQLIGRPDWQDLVSPSPKANADLKEQLNALFLEKTQAEWMDLAQKEDICLTPIYQLDDLENDPHLAARKVFRSQEIEGLGTHKSINQPLKFKHTVLDEEGWAAPSLGADSIAILEELGYDTAKIDALKSEKVCF